MRGHTLKDHAIQGAMAGPHCLERSFVFFSCSTMLLAVTTTHGSFFFCIFRVSDTLAGLFLFLVFGHAKSSAVCETLKGMCAMNLGCVNCTLHS
jgi:hypothetical protein